MLIICCLERYHNKIQQIIYFYIQDRANVNDLTQEVLLKVYRYLDYFKEESLFSTWLYKITQNTVKNYFRSINLRLDSEAQFVNDQYSSLGDSPEHILMNMEFGKQIEYAISRLSDELRNVTACIFLRDILMKILLRKCAALLVL